MAGERDDREQLDFEIAFYEAVLARKPGYFDVLNALAYDYTARGLYPQGLEADRRLARMRPEDPGILYNLACSLALTEHIDEAFSTLARAIFLGYRDFRHIKKDPDLEPLRRDPRFKTFIQLARRNSHRRNINIS